MRVVQTVSDRHGQARARQPILSDSETGRAAGAVPGPHESLTWHPLPLQLGGGRRTDAAVVQVAALRAGVANLKAPSLAACLPPQSESFWQARATVRVRPLPY